MNGKMERLITLINSFSISLKSEEHVYLSYLTHNAAGEETIHLCMICFAHTECAFALSEFQ